MKCDHCGYNDARRKELDESASAQVANLIRQRDEAVVGRDALVRAEAVLTWCDANWTRAAVDRGAGLPMLRTALAAVREALR